MLLDCGYHAAMTPVSAMRVAIPQPKWPAYLDVNIVHGWCREA
jgi:hypothetical protein